MAWTEPRTWVSGEQTTAALLNTHLRDNLDSLGRDPGQQVHIGTTPFELWYPAGLPVYGSWGSLGSSLVTLGRLYGMPFSRPRGRVIDRIGFRVTTAAGAGGVARCGIYQATSATNIYPSALVLDSGELVTTSTGVKSASVNQNLDPDVLYWFALLFGVAAPQVSEVDSGLRVLGLSSALVTPAQSLFVAQAYGALPATFPAGATLEAGTDFIVAARFSS